MSEHRTLSDQELVEIMRGGKLPADVSLADVAHEVHRARLATKRDSHRAAQIRKLRWQAEALTQKAETAVRASDAIIRDLPTLMRAIDELVSRPAIERETCAAIAKWLESDRVDVAGGGRVIGAAIVAAGIRAEEWR